MSIPAISTARHHSEGLKSNWSKYHLSTLRKTIQTKNLNNRLVKEQIVLVVQLQQLERETSRKMAHKIRSHVLVTEENGVDFINRLEEERYKHEYLNHLVSHYLRQIEEQKQKEYQNTINNIENSEYDQLKHQIKTLEKELEDLTNRVNASHCEANKKYEVVKAERRERTVFSTQFNNFETETFSLSTYYKQLVLERTVLEEQYLENVSEFEKIEDQGSKRLEDFENSVAKRKTDFQEAVSDYEQPFYEQPIFTKTRTRLCGSKMEKTDTNFYSSSEDEKKLLSLQKYKKTKEILNLLSVESLQELKTKAIDIESVIDQYSCRIEQISNDIFSQSKCVEELQRQLMRKNPTARMSAVQKQKRRLKNLKKENLRAASEQLATTEKEIVDFCESAELKILAKELKVSSKDIDSDNPHEGLENCLEKIQNSLFTNLGSCEFKKSRIINHRKSIFLEIPFVQSEERVNTLNQSQNLLCPLFEGKKSTFNSKRTKTSASKVSIKKLSSILKTYSKVKGPTEIASKKQLIKEGVEAFNQEGLEVPLDYHVRYEN